MEAVLLLSKGSRCCERENKTTALYHMACLLSHKIHERKDDENQRFTPQKLMGLTDEELDKFFKFRKTMFESVQQLMLSKMP